MKRLFLPSLCALLSLTALTSCQKEEESSLDLAKMLTSELKTVVDTKTADAAAPRIAVINKRFQDAGVQVFAVNGTALLRSSQRPAEYNEALTMLVAEMGRVRASKPVAESDGDVDRDALLAAVGKANGTDGTEYYRDSIDKSHGSAGEFAPYYGSETLQEAITYVADPSAVSMFTFADDIEPVPAKTEVADDDEAAADDDDATEDEEEVTVDEDDADEEPADDEPADDDEDEDDDSAEIDIDFGDIGI